MKFFSATLWVISLVVLAPLISEGQTSQVNHKVNIEIPEVALLGLVSEESGLINLMAEAPGEAGDPISLENIQQEKRVWLNYSSIIRSENHRRKVMAAVQGEIPVGLRLVVEATEASGSGGGMLGKSAGKVYLSSEPVEVITDIGSCFTGKGVNTGHLLSYRLESENNVNNLAALNQNQVTLQVLYTLTDNN